MGKYKLLFKKSVAKDLRGIPKKDVAAILRTFDVLAEDPRPPKCEKLSNREQYRVRRGVYRIVYEINDEELCVIVVRVGRRREVYSGR
jgi:mRNA interferase RelE/StbE